MAVEKSKALRIVVARKPKGRPVASKPAPQADQNRD